ncbi:GTP-binding protein [Spirochaetia bacterium 38H-sp]|uniref:GTP-binding protein n=1 Tax=Rarispira pelagica TaxID=3141764 RepID=A0ABU9UBR6_9SPIR
MKKDMKNNKQRLSIVMVGHVDHGKSTILGRLLSEAGALPKGKLEQIKEYCRTNAREFEYAYLLDALKEEQAQGITIDSARIFFKLEDKEFICIDAPGHVEFIKNMVTGASRADAAFIVIDAKEGIKENSRRHGYLLSFLGVKQVVVLINKMDIIDYSEEQYRNIAENFDSFLSGLGIKPLEYIPVSGRNGDNLVSLSDMTPWYSGPSVKEAFLAFSNYSTRLEYPFRLPVQDVYKFTRLGDNRRIIAGTVETGTLKKGDHVKVFPSGAESTVANIETLYPPGPDEVSAGIATGITLTDSIYVKRGELLAKEEDPPSVAYSFRVSLFWLAPQPLIKEKKYILRLNASREAVYLTDIISVVDSSELSTESNRDYIGQYDISECILSTVKPVAFDLYSSNPYTGRFVIIDQYEISGGGVILETIGSSHIDKHVDMRESAWRKNQISPICRGQRFSQKPQVILFTGKNLEELDRYAKELGKRLFNKGWNSYYLAMDNLLRGIDYDILSSDREEHLLRLGELLRLLYDTGLVVLTVIVDADIYEIELLKKISQPAKLMIIDTDSNLPANMSDFKLERNADISVLDGLLRKKSIIEEYNI